MTWKDIYDIAEALVEKYPDQKPLDVRFTDLHQWVTGLEGFDDDPKASNEGILESIQMAWNEEFEEEE